VSDILGQGPYVSPASCVANGSSELGLGRFYLDAVVLLVSCTLCRRSTCVVYLIVSFFVNSHDDA
jgi:hypothetical protein